MTDISAAVPLGELITFRDPEGYNHDGILYRRPGNNVTIVHIHGSLGNFYHNYFLRLMASAYLASGINMLSFNLTAHDGVSEGFRYDTNFEYVGGSVVRFDTCLADIAGAVSFCETFSHRIILQGHSLGCDRILYYLTKKGEQCDVILLSPCDSYQLQSKWIAPETVEQQIARLRESLSDNKSLDWLPLKEYGINQGAENYTIPITRGSLLSIMEGPPFKLIRLSKPVSFRLNSKAIIYIGGKDSLQSWPHLDMFRYFEERIKSVVRVFCPDGDHDLSACEREVIAQILGWVSTN